MIDISRLKYYVHFVGYSRSGHTLVAQILNAHKDVIISNEVKDYKYFKNGESSEFLFESIYINSVEFAKSGSVWPTIKGYNSHYRINSHQGNTTNPIIIGDKFAPSAHNVLKNIVEYKKWIGYPIKFIYVSRNKEDQIKSNMLMNGKTYKFNLERRCLQEKIAKQVIKEHNGIEVTLEAIKCNPCFFIRYLCEFLEIGCSFEFLHDCCGIIK